MLTPYQLGKLPDNISNIYQQLENFIIEDISRRVAKVGKITETAEWQATRAQEFGMSLETLEKKIAEILNLSFDEVEDLFEQSAVESIKTDSVLYEQAKLTPMHLDTSPELKGYLEAAITQTKGELKNISQSLGFCIKGINGKIKNKKLTQFYQETLDLAQFQVSSGVIDYNTAVKNAVKSMTRSGVRFIDYESGWSNRVDVAVRRATLTGANQMSQQMNVKTIEDLETDIVEVTAHSGARPSHAKWQGKWYSLSGKSTKYPSLRKVTHYGEGDGLGGWYCRHQFYAVIPGVSTPTYTEEQLKNIDPEPFGYKGKTYTHYEATQYQRKIETAMRETKREQIGFKAAGLDEDFTNSSIKLQRQKQEYKDFSNAAGLRQKKERAQVLGYNKSISQKSVWANKKAENKMQEDK